MVLSVSLLADVCSHYGVYLKFIKKDEALFPTFPQVKFGTEPQCVALKPCRAMQHAETFSTICFRCSNSLWNMKSRYHQYGHQILSQIQPPSPEEADLQSCRAGGFCYTKIKNEHRIRSFSYSPTKFSAEPVQYIRNIYSARFPLQSAWPEFTV